MLTTLPRVALLLGALARTFCGSNPEMDATSPGDLVGKGIPECNLDFDLLLCFLDIRATQLPNVGNCSVMMQLPLFR